MSTDSIERLERDTQADRAVARLRGIGGVVVLLSAGILSLGQGGTIRWLWVIAGLLAGLGWIAAWRRSRSATFEDSLQIGPDDLVMCVRGKTSSINWQDIEEVLADEERLVVRLIHHTETPDFVVPLVWKGTGLHSLAELLSARLTQSQTPPNAA